MQKIGAPKPERRSVFLCSRNEIRRTVLPYRGGTYYIAGGVSLDFADGARLYRKDAALEKADLIVKGAARLYFGPGTDLHYGAAANAFGSVGNGGLSVIPSVDG